MKKFVCAVALAGLLAAFAAQAAVTPPDALVKQTVDEVMVVIKQSKDKRTLHDLAEKKVLPNFDFREMTILAVGKHWRQASEAQRKALENGFRSLLVSTYTAALSSSTSTNYTVEVKPAELKPGDKETMVRTTVTQAGRQPIPIDYRMTLTSGGWKVYDVVVENLSLVTNYRSSFNSEISRSGIDGLIKTIETKNQRLAEG
ncbi:MAG: ABC transporter substrate-binding protein [Betaproteobacteria bacterium]|nr:ABC transporter substrate-binding protein [Betaproteobacteria bacterium]